MTYDNFQVTLCIERGIEKGSILYRSQLVEHLQQQLNEWSGLLNERTSGYHIFSMVKHCFGQYQETIFARASFTFAMKWWTYLTSFFISGNVVFFQMVLRGRLVTDNYRLMDSVMRQTLYTSFTGMLKTGFQVKTNADLRFLNLIFSEHDWTCLDMLGSQAQSCLIQTFILSMCI